MSSFLPEWVVALVGGRSGKRGRGRAARGSDVGVLAARRGALEPLEDRTLMTVHVVSAPITATAGQATGSIVVGSLHEDDPFPYNSGDFDTTINWGDGTQTVGTLTQTGPWDFDIIGNHTYAVPGSYSTSVFADSLWTATTDTSGNTATVSPGAAAITATWTSVSGNEGTPLTGATVATFTTADGSAVAGDFTGTIDWGDGQTSAAAFAANSNGGFDVTGTHTYAGYGTYPVAVAISAADGGSASASSWATIGDAYGFLTPTPLSAGEGVAFGGSVGTLADDNVMGVAGDWSVTINWGDGSTSAGALTPLGGGQFDVTGGHTYASPGIYNTTVTATSTGGSSSAGMSVMSVGSAPITISVAPVAAQARHSTGTFDVAAFSDGDTLATAADYSAQIAWNDGTTSPGTIVTDGAGGWKVQGSHTWAVSGNYGVQVTVTDTTDGGWNVASNVATVSHAALGMGAGVMTAPAGSPAPALVATLTSADASVVAGDFTGSILWGDGTTTPAAFAANSNGGFDVTGTHAYAAPGVYNRDVVIYAADGGSIGMLGGVVVSPATISAGGGSLSGTEGMSTMGVVATFTSGSASAADFGALIDWGDGSPTSVGAVAPDGLGGFVVTGSHAYTTAGTFAATVSVTDGASTDVAATTVTVANAALSGAGVDASGVRAHAWTGTVAHFTDANPFAVDSDYTATIDWGDGTTSTGTVVAANGGGWDVVGTHNYATKGVFNVAVSVDDGEGGTVSASATAAFRNPRYTKYPLAGRTAPLINVLRGRTNTVTVATMRGQLPEFTAGDLSGTIDWGDGTTSAATFTAGTEPGTWTITGTHAWASKGSYFITVTINDSFGRTATVTTPAYARRPRSAGVSASPAAGSSLGRRTPGAVGVDFTVTRHKAFDGRVAHVNGADVSTAAAGYAATIDWGDGTTSAGEIVASARGGFDVLGAHAYDAKGSYAVTVTITDPAAQSPWTAESVATVRRPKVLGVL